MSKLNLLECDKACHGCVKGYKNKHDLKPGGLFQISCNGIPKEYLSPEMKESLSEDDTLSMLSMIDPVTWARETLDWHCEDPDGAVWKRKTIENSLGEVTPYIEEKYGELVKQGKSAYHRPYQRDILRCSAARKVLRLGRQLGKSEVMCIAILHALYTHKGFKVLIITPYQSQVELLFGRLSALIKSSKLTQNSVKRYVKAPNHTIELHNGSVVRGFTSGAKSGGNADSVRGQRAQLLVFDEADYLNSADMGSALSVITNYPDAMVWMSSTPTGKREKFYDNCHSPLWKEYHYPAWNNPLWSDDLESFYRGEFTDIQYNHEVGAEFGEQEQGVYQTSYVDDAMVDYNYSDNSPEHDKWIYTIGVDWNDFKVGTTIAVVGFNPASRLFKLMTRIVYQRDGWTQLGAIERLVELNRHWKPKWIYIDYGYGNCVGPDTLIQTDTGAKFIKDITLSDKVFTKEGNYKEILDIWHAEPKESYKVKVLKCPEVVVSHCHPFLVYETENRYKDKYFNEEKLKWKNASELNSDKDFIAIRKSNFEYKTSRIIDLTTILSNIGYDDKLIWNKNSYSSSDRELSNHTLAKKFNSSTPIITRMRRAFREGKPLKKNWIGIHKNISAVYGDKWWVLENIKFNRYIDIGSYDFQVVLGWYLSEGNANPSSVEIWQKSDNHVEEFQECINSCKNLFGEQVTIGIKPDTQVIRVTILGKIAEDIFKYFGGSLSDNKRLHESMLDIESGILIRSFLYGDGHISTNNFDADMIGTSITSPHLISQFRQMFIDKGILPSFRFVDKRQDHHLDQYQIDMSGNSETLEKLENFLQLKLQNSKTRVNRRKYIDLPHYILAPVVSVGKIGTRDDLIDLCIKDDQSFTGNGMLLHNTQYEIIKKFGYDAFSDPTKGAGHPDAKLSRIVKQYNFGSKIIIKDLFTKQDIEKESKPFLIENSVRRFEQRMFHFSKHDKQLEAEYRGYIIDHVTTTGAPVYKQGNEKVGDHNLDAVNLALVAITLEESDFGKVAYDNSVGFVGPLNTELLPTKPGSPTDPSILQMNSQKMSPSGSKPTMDRNTFTDKSVLPSNQAPGANLSKDSTLSKKNGLWAWPGWERDAPAPSRSTGPVMGRRVPPPTRKKI